MSAWLTYGLVALVLTGVAIVRPLVARPNLLFGVAFAAQDLRRDPTSRSLKRQYASQTLAVAVLIWGSLALISRWGHHGPFLLAGIGLFLLALLVLTARAHRLSRQYRAQLDLPQAGTRLTVALDQLAHERVLTPGWVLSLVPLVAVAFGLRLRAVAAADLAVAVVVAVSFLACRHLTASVRGSATIAPGASQGRNTLLLTLLALGVLAQAFGLAVAWRPARRGLLTLLFGGAVVASLAVLLGMWLQVTRQKPPAGPVLADDDHWHWGVFYFDSNNAAVFVAKRIGVGLTLNYARPAAWLLVIGLVVVLVGVALCAS